MKKTTVVVVDDSAFIRDMFTKMLSSDPGIEVVGAAMDPIVARDMIKRLNPDVITLDIEMPRMDGISFLEKIMSLRPMPVVMVSSLTQKGAEETIRSLELGAVDCIGKPQGEDADITSLKTELISKVKAASRARVKYIDASTLKEKRKPISAAKGSFDPKKHILAIGSSTGGVEALREIIPFLPKNSFPVVIVQHMPEKFTSAFAQRLNSISTMRVQEAKDKQPIEPGNVYISPGDRHMEVKLNRTGEGFYCVLKDGENVSGHKPSVDVLFESMANNVGRRALGLILTGMGKDGTKGIMAMKQAGAYTMCQDEATSVVYGMPKAAYLSGAIDKQLPLEKIADHLVNKKASS